MVEAIKGYGGEGDSVVYEYPDGKKEIWRGGTRSWRNRNPGNIEYKDFNDWVGQIGWAYRFAVFNDPKWGKRAIGKLLVNYAKRKKNLSLEQAIYEYAPPHENPTPEYVANLSRWTGISKEAKVLSLTEEQIASIVEAIIRQEAYRVGTIEIIPAPKKSGKYVWRTARDEKVRKEHAARDGMVFDFANPPPGGNPGESYGCRCTAVPLPDKQLDEVFKK